MNPLVIVLIVLLVLALGGAPTWGYHSYGWYPSGGLGLVVLILLLVLLFR